MRRLHEISAGTGDVIFEWSSKGTLCAIAGPKRRVLVHDKHGALVHEIHVPPPLVPPADPKQCSCVALQWDAGGDLLAVLPTSSPVVYVWSAVTQEVQKVEVDAKGRDVAAIAWSAAGAMLAAATAKGALVVYSAHERRRTALPGKHCKHVLCAAWGPGGQLALAGADKLVSLTDGVTGALLGTWPLRAEPVELAACPDIEGLRSRGPSRDSDAGPGPAQPADAPGEGAQPAAAREQEAEAQQAGQGHGRAAGHGRVEGVGGSGGCMFTMVGTRGALYVLQAAPTPCPPVELLFQKQYGLLVRHEWCGVGMVLLGFSCGQVVVVAPGSEQPVSQEVACARPLDSLTALSFCPALGRVAVGGGGRVLVMDVTSTGALGEAGEVAELPAGEEVAGLRWSGDGQILSMASSSGLVSSYLAAVPAVWAACGASVAQLTSLTEVTVADVGTQHAVSVQVATEPAMCALGPCHVAVAINNQVWFHELGPAAAAAAAAHAGPRPAQLHRSYLATVSALALSASHAAALTQEGRVIVHPLAPPAVGAPPDEGDVVLPLPAASTGGGKAPRDQQPLLCVAMSDRFVVTGSAGGTLSYWLADSMALVEEHRHRGGGITNVWLQPQGALCAFADQQGAACVLNPTSGTVHQLRQPEGRVTQLLWDTADPDVCVASDGAELAVHLYARNGLDGPALVAVGGQPLPSDYEPLAMCGGTLHCRLASGAIDGLLLDTHSALAADASSGGSQDGPDRQQHLRLRLQQAVRLQRFLDAWAACQALAAPDAWRQLADAALQQLDVALATAAARMGGDAALVLALQPLAHLEERCLLAGHALVLLGRSCDRAQDLFLRSSQPLAALHMRRDLRDWGKALALARRLDPGLVAMLSQEHAAELELMGEYQAACSHYQAAIDAVPAASDPAAAAAADLLACCQAGVARCLLRLGDIAAGCALALQLGSVPLFREAGAILEGLRALRQAADMYERGGLLEQAAALYLQLRDFAAAAPLMARITSGKLQLQYAAALEAEGLWAEAAEAYLTAGDIESAVRLLMGPLGALAAALQLVRDTRNPAAAALLARHCLAAGDAATAIEELLLAGLVDEAFAAAKAAGLLGLFDRLVAASAASPVDLDRLSAFYEARGELGQAAELAARAGRWQRAVDLFLKVGTLEGMGAAISTVGQVAAAEEAGGGQGSGSDAATAAVLGACVEARLPALAVDAAVRDELRFRLHLAMGRLADAARDALEAARMQQEEGSYRAAHTQLLASIMQLEGRGMAPPAELMQALCLLHSYVLVKPLIAAGDHEGAALMLARVARSIAAFPRHLVPILTSAVVECQRAGMKRTALEYASVLMRPEHRHEVPEKYRRKIEALVRKPEAAPPDCEPLSDCPFCSLPGPSTELACIGCRAAIPWDVSTGKRMRLEDWCECPACRFPCSGAGLRAILAVDGRCPMCSQGVEAGAVVPVPSPLDGLQGKVGAMPWQ